MSVYFYKDVSLNMIVESGGTLSISNFSPAINYKTKTNASGNNNAISLPYNNTNDVIPYNILIRADNGTTYWYSTQHYNSDNQSPGTSNSSIQENLNSFVNNPKFKYSKIRCILIGGSAGGSGGFGHNARYTGAGGGSGAYLSFDLFLDPPHSSSTLTLTAGGSGNGGRGANRSAGGVGGVGQLGASGLASSLSYYSGVNNQTSTFSANGGLRAEAQGLTGAAGTVSISANHTYNTIYSRAGNQGNAGASAGTFGTGGNGPLANTITQATSYTYGSDNVPTYTLSLPNSGIASFPYQSWTNNTIANNTDAQMFGGKGGNGGPNFDDNKGWGGVGGTGGFARIYFFVDP